MKKLVSAIFLLVFSLGGHVFAENQSFFTGNNVSDICRTPACHNVALRLLHDMDPSVNPCDDFYQFSCGGYLNSTVLVDNLNYLDKFTELRRKVFENITMILEQNSSINEFKYLKLARTLYKTCKNKKDTIWKFKKAIKNWPVLKKSQWNKRTLRFNQTMFKVGNTTQWKNYFFEFYSIGDGSFIVVEPYKSALNAEDLVQGLNNTIVKEYYDSMINAAVSLNNFKDINYGDIVKKLLDFEIELARARLTAENSNPAFDRVRMTLGELMNNCSFFNWQEYISYLRGSPVNSSTTIIIINFSYMKKLQYLLNSTRKIQKIVANYVIWKHAEENIQTARDLESRNCLNIVLTKLPIAVGAIYFQNYNYSLIINAGNEIKNMTLNIKLNIFGMIMNATWIEDDTKIYMLKKLMSSQHVIGYVNEFTNNSKINKFYENLELFDNENLNDAMQRIKLFEKKNQFLNSIDINWSSIVSKFYNTEAFFQLDLNLIIISYIMLQSDFFDIEQPNYMNYGALGSIIGHELTHGFDIDGINYDSYNRWNEWTFSKNMSECIIEQYNNFTVPEVGLKVNGTITQDENVADNAGIKAAYQAYEKLLNNNEKLPGLIYTPKQLFWISYANSRCEIYSNDFLKNNYLFDVHPPSKFRVIGTLSNMPEFSKDFSCPLGSNMNPTKKCSFW